MICACGNKIHSDNCKVCPYCGRAVSDKDNNHSSTPVSSAQSDNDNINRLVPERYIKRVKAIGSKFASERRIVTIMFVDIVGSTAISETRDPEDVIAIINGAFRVICKPIKFYEGTIARFMGDGLLCFFGAPDSHEDDPIRSCNAALRILSDIQQYAKTLEKSHSLTGFAVRIGINTDLVVVGEVGTEYRVEYTAMGDGINIAARLEQKAAPNTVLISEKTQRLVKSRFETRSFGALPIRGILQPIEVHQLIGRKDRKVIAQSRSAESAFVGRKSEKELVLDRLMNLTDSGGGVLSVTGEAGAGKSRLIDECLDQLPDRHKVHLINCSTFTRHVPYMLISKLVAIVLNRTSPEDSGAWYDIDNVSSDESELLSVFRVLEEHMPLTETHVIVIDDLQWADGESLTMLRSIIPMICASNVLFIFGSRIDNDEMVQFHTWLQANSSSSIQSVALAPLGQEETEELFKNVLGKRLVPANVKRTICENAKGNPFFLKTLIQSVIETIQNNAVDDKNSLIGLHLDTVKIPRSLQGAVMSRIDQLHPVSRFLLKYATVMGKNIDTRVLKHITKNTFHSEEFERHFSELVVFGYLSENSDHFEFSSTLVAESIYKSLLRSQRQEVRDEIDKAREEVYSNS